MPKLILYGGRQVPYTEKCRRALVLKGLPFELREPSGPEDFARWSPETGLLPVMTVDGELVSDSTRILQRIDEIQPEPPLLSSDPTIAAQQRQLEDWADESFLWYFREWLELERATAAPAAPKRGLFARLRERARPARPPGLTREQIVRGVEDRLNDLVNLLGTRPFFYADRISMADLTVYGMLVSLGRDTIPGAAARIAARPVLGEFMRRVEKETGG
ncbi:MAG TPA: glutathione S-transferase family protein [Myxococcota bacterium]